jgi:hypothetical protein
MILGNEKKGGGRASVPRPDRSTFTPNPTVRADDRELDLGWAEGEWEDGRPYRAELWSWKDLTVVTFFFSVLGLEDAGDAELRRMLEKESLVEFPGIPRVYPDRVRDSAGNEMWSVSIPVQEGNQSRVQLGCRLNPYPVPLRRQRESLLEFLNGRMSALAARKS